MTKHFTGLFIYKLLSRNSLNEKWFEVLWLINVFQFIYFIIVYYGIFRGSKIRGSMKGSMFLTFVRNAHMFSIKLTQLIKTPVHEENNETISYKVNLT